MKELEQQSDEHTCTSAAIIRDGKILLGLRHYTPDKWQTISVWTTPGGRCDEGETIEHGLRRETEEETGINDLQIEEFLGRLPGAKSPDTLYAFICSTKQEPMLMEPEKFSEWAWHPLSAIPDNFINPNLRKALRERK